MQHSNWLLEGIPVYPDGELLNELFLLGGGLHDGFEKPFEEKSVMHIVNGTSEEAFLSYCDELVSAGFRVGFSRDAEHGLYRELIGNGKLLYVYWMRRTGQARIIDDRSSVCFADFLSGVPSEEIRTDTELMQFGLFYGDPLKGRVSSCGMLYVIRQRSNKLFLVDGGLSAQCTNAALEELMVRLRELTQTGDGEPMTVSCWFCTHAHNDHMDLFISLMKRYGDVLKVERVLFNFPHPEYAGLPEEIAKKFAHEYLDSAMNALRQSCPDARYMKAHTGQKFDFGNLAAEVILTHEDMIYENGARAYLGGLNTSSTVLKLSFDGSSLLILGDADENNGDVLQKYYLPDELSCTYLQAAHHLANLDENIYSYVRAESVLIPQGRLRIHRIRREHYGILCKYFDRDRFYLEGDYTVIFRVKDGSEEVTYYQLTGGPFDPKTDGQNLWSPCTEDF